MPGRVVPGPLENDFQRASGGVDASDLQAGRVEVEIAVKADDPGGPGTHDEIKGDGLPWSQDG